MLIDNKEEFINSNKYAFLVNEYEKGANIKRMYYDYNELKKLYIYDPISAKKPIFNNPKQYIHKDFMIIKTLLLIANRRNKYIAKPIFTKIIIPYLKNIIENKQYYEICSSYQVYYNNCYGSNYYNVNLIY